MPTKPAADVFNRDRDFGGESVIHMFDTPSRIDKTLSFMITLILTNKIANKYYYRFIDMLCILL